MINNTTKSILHIYTIDFPFGNLESILENEIPVLSEKFNFIYIQPLSSKKKIRRNVPENVIILEALNDRNDIDTKSIFLRNFLFIIKILLTEFIHCKKKFFFIKKIRVYNVLLIKAIYDSSKIVQSLKNKPEEIVFYSYWMNDWALALAILKHKNKIPSFVFRCGGFDIYDERHAGNYLPFRYYIYKQVSKIFPNSKNANEYIKKKNIFPEKLKFQYLGTSDYGLNNFDEKVKFTIVSCSSLIPLKRVDLIIEILKFVTIEINWIHFGDGKCNEQIKQLSKQLPANVNCVLKGEQPNKDIIDFYKNNSVSLFITTSASESLPVSVQEAISFGIPVIATNAGGMSEIVNGQTGYLIEKNFEPRKIAEIINVFRDSEMNTALFRKRIREFWLNNFEAKNVYGKFYEELIA